MNFLEAYQAAKAGAKIRRVDFHEDTYVEFTHRLLWWHTGNRFEVTETQLEGEWELYNEYQEVTEAEAIEAMKKGKKVEAEYRFAASSVAWKPVNLLPCWNPSYTLNNRQRRWRVKK